MPTVVLNYVFFSFCSSEELVMPSLIKSRRKTFVCMKGRCTVAPCEYSWNKGNKESCLDMHA